MAIGREVPREVARQCSRQTISSALVPMALEQSRGYAVGDESVKEPTAISVERYHEVADAYLEGVQQSLEELSEADESVDVEFSAGVLTAVIPSAGTYVINKQPPNKQIWLSSPVSGPKRYDYVSSEGTAGGEWVYLRDGSTMTNLLKEEIDITVDKHGDE
ncbi:Mitochondrial chaperone Frataxin [Ptychographa xylographoides]|nr:Mitochondrial chaperone Frataxin [Ptychographa xylographoides]